MEFVLTKTALAQQDLFIIQVSDITRDWKIHGHDILLRSSSQEYFHKFAWIGTSIYELTLKLKNKSKTQVKQCKNYLKNYHKLFMISRAHDKKMVLRN